MLIYLGSTEITKIYIGDKEIVNIYLGNTQIWSSIPAGPPVPLSIENIQDYQET